MLGWKDGEQGHIPQETPDNMLQQPRSLLFHQLADHVAEDGPDGVESLVSSADII